MARKKSSRVRVARPSSEVLTLAVPKGRTLGPVARLFERAGVDTTALTSGSRKLVREDKESGLKFLLLKPDDVPTYVDHGAAQLGVVGQDVLLERDYDLYHPLELGIGQCRLVVAGPAPAALPSARQLRVATKFVKTARHYFLQRGVPAEIIYVHGSVELAPLTGLSDVIVDLVESGETLRQNGLVVYEEITSILSVLVANRTALKLHDVRVRELIDRLRTARDATPAS